MTTTSGSLFSGTGGLDMAVAEVFGAEPLWFADNDPDASRVLAHHWPDVPNLGDITSIDWTAVPRPDILTGGFPCTDISPAGKQLGLIRYGAGQTRSGLWAQMCQAINMLRPALVVAENVRGLTSVKADSDVEFCPWCMGGTDPESVLRALGAVLGDLADIGYDAVWYGLRAADVGAPHNRFRIFILAWPANAPREPREFNDGDDLRFRRQPDRRCAPARGGADADAAGERGGHRPGLPAGIPAGVWWLGSDHDGAPAFGGSGAVDAGPPGLEGAEPAGQQGRPDAGAGGAVPDAGEWCPECGDPTAWHDAGGSCAGLCEGRCQPPHVGWSVPAVPDADGGRPSPGRDNARWPPVTESFDSCPRDKSREADADADRGGRRPDQPAVPAGEPDAAGDCEHHPPHADAERGGRQRGAHDQERRQVRRAAAAGGGEIDWGIYEPAIRRWEQCLGRPAPAPAARTSRNGGYQLTGEFDEWLMGLPAGHVTHPDIWQGVRRSAARNAQLRLCGNGVLPQQAVEALRRMIPMVLARTQGDR